jgi:hypothetical protein
MKIEHFNKENKFSSDAFAWRYMNFEKLWDLLSNRKIFFASLDSFEDILEGLNIDLKVRLELRKIHKYELPEQQYDEFKFKDELDISFEELRNWQQGSYCLCWYLTENNNHFESIAMWKFFNVSDGFVLKMPLEKLIKIVSNSLKEYNTKEFPRGYYGKVEYLDLREHNALLNSKSSNENIIPALIKHPAYRFENEFRFLLHRENIDGKFKNKKGLSIDLISESLFDNSQIEIIANPNIGIRNYRLYRDELKKIGYSLKISTIPTKSILA